MPYQVEPLPYDYNALEPYIDEETMHLHHDKHYKAYVDNLNTALQNQAQFQNLPLDELARRLTEIPEDIRIAVRNNGGGAVNHGMFWKIMAPSGQGGAPSGELSQAINQSFGSLDNLKKQINDTGLKRFGSGWTWLVMNPNGQLQVTSTANQDSPFIENLYPILGNDVWEHAYYLKYQNRRGDYLNAWWNVVNWNEVGKRYQEAKNRSQPISNTQR